MCDSTSVPSGGVLRLSPAELQGPVQARQGGGEHSKFTRITDVWRALSRNNEDVSYLHIKLTCSSLLSSACLCFLCPSKCDGTDLTPKIQELKFQCIVFLNIPRCVL